MLAVQADRPELCKSIVPAEGAPESPLFFPSFMAQPLAPPGEESQKGKDGKRKHQGGCGIVRMKLNSEEAKGVRTLHFRKRRKTGNMIFIL